MNVLIIEDEPQAAQQLERLIAWIEPAAQVLAKLDTVKRSVQWLRENPPPALIFMDVQLADGISFSIFEQCAVSAPIIFTTAYDAYALKAFKVNSLDYLLKPVDKDELAAAIDKFKAQNRPGDAGLLRSIEQTMQMLTRRYKARFVIKVGEHLRTVETDQIGYLYSQEKTTFCVTADGRHHVLDHSLEQLEDMLDPTRFFRINRKYFVASAAIVDIIQYTNSRLRLVLKGSADKDVIVARERVQEFKRWLDR